LKLTLISLSYFFTFFIGFSQTEKRISGKVLSEGIALSDIDIVNMSTKKVAVSDNNGHFSILAKVNDELYIISKIHTDRKIVLSQNDFDANNLIVDLSKKPIELEEVKITKSPLGGFKVSQADIDQITLEKKFTRPVNKSVYTGEIENGVDFVRIAKGIASLFKDKDAKPPKPEIVFKEYVKDNFQEDFYTKTLRLKPEQVFAFIEFCDADTNAKKIVQNGNQLEVMHFLIVKSEEFKKF